MCLIRYVHKKNEKIPGLQTTNQVKTKSCFTKAKSELITVKKITWIFEQNRKKVDIMPKTRIEPATSRFSA